MTQQLERGVKAKAIRECLANNPGIKAKAVVAKLAEQGIEVAVGNVYIEMSKSKEKTAPVVNNSQPTMDDLQKFLPLAEAVGGIDEAKALLDSLKEMMVMAQPFITALGSVQRASQLCDTILTYRALLVPKTETTSETTDESSETKEAA